MSSIQIEKNDSLNNSYFIDEEDDLDQLVKDACIPISGSPKNSSEYSHENTERNREFKESNTKPTHIVESEVERELRLMKEKVKLLETQLMQKSQVAPLINDTYISNSLKSPNSFNKSTYNKKKINKTQALYEDIFTPSTSSSSKESGIFLRERKYAPKISPGDDSQNTKKIFNECGKMIQLTSNINPNVPLHNSSIEDEGSDWEDLDGDTPQLSKCGKELQNVLNKNRVAHNPKYDTSILQNRKPKWSSTKDDISSSIKIERINNIINSQPSRDHLKNDNCHVDKYSSIRIINPLISSTILDSRMGDRKMIRLSKLHCKVNTVDMDSDWVTMGVIVSKSEVKMSSNGKQYSLWVLSDLVDCDQSVKMLLFSDVHKSHWKLCVGTVVGLLNATIMKDSEKFVKKNSTQISITVDHPLKIMIMGTSKDYGVCKSRTKNGKSCLNFVNKQHGDFCIFHIQSNFKKMSAKRGEIQSSHTGIVPKSLQQKLLGNKTKNNDVIYGGKLYNSSNKKRVSLNDLQSYSVQSKLGQKVKHNTLAIHDLIPEDRELLKALNGKHIEDDKKAFGELLTTPSPGSLNLVKHMIRKESSNEKCKKEVECANSVKSTSLQTITASDFLKSVKNDLKSKISNCKNTRNSLSPSSVSFQSNVDVVFDFENKPLVDSRKNINDMAKIKAITQVKLYGGLDKSNPNSIKKAIDGRKKTEVIKRLNSCMESDSESDCNEPSKKKIRQLSSFDLNSEPVKKLLSARSKYDAHLTDIEQEKLDLYFSTRETSEKMEDKMLTTTRIKCKIFTCVECQYTYFSTLQSCRDQGHHIKISEGAKYFFKCKECKWRITSLHRYPSKSCKKCGSSNFEKTGMRSEQTITKFHELSVTGDTDTYLDSQVKPSE